MSPSSWARVKRGWFRKEPVVEELGPAHEAFAARGYDPLVTLGTLEELLTGGPYDEIAADPRCGAAVLDGEPLDPDLGAVTLTDSLRDALAGADDERLAAVVQLCSRTEELSDPDGDEGTREEHMTFLRSLRDLAASALAKGQRLYCYWQV